MGAGVLNRFAQLNPVVSMVAERTLGNYYIALLSDGRIVR